MSRLDPIFATLAPGTGTIPRTPGSRIARRHRRARLPALRSERRRALRQDGAQRHRVRPDGGLRRGSQHPRARRHRAACPRRGCRDHAAPRSGRLLLRARPRRDRRGVAARQRDLVVAARSPAAALARDPRLERSPAASRTPARALDAAGSDRRGRPGPRPHRRAVRALRLARRGGLPEPRAVGDAVRVRGHAEKS